MQLKISLALVCLAISLPALAAPVEAPHDPPKGSPATAMTSPAPPHLSAVLPHQRGKKPLSYKTSGWHFNGDSVSPVHSLLPAEASPVSPAPPSGTTLSPPPDHHHQPPSGQVPSPPSLKLEPQKSRLSDDNKDHINPVSPPSPPSGNAHLSPPGHDVRPSLSSPVPPLKSIEPVLHKNPRRDDNKLEGPANPVSSPPPAVSCPPAPSDDVPPPHSSHKSMQGQPLTHPSLVICSAQPSLPKNPLHDGNDLEAPSSPVSSPTPGLAMTSPMSPPNPSGNVSPPRGSVLLDPIYSTRKGSVPAN